MRNSPAANSSGSLGVSVAPATLVALNRLTAWWDEFSRDFPWRAETVTAWGVLLSEVMSQQTPMARVLPYWNSWIAAWPTPADLARASTAEILTAWGKLGYPRRALRLRECAQMIVAQFGGEVPSNYADLISLPGIGDYTASAVLSFYFHQRVVVLDTNIRRVLSRAFLGLESHGGTASAAEKRIALEVLPSDSWKSVEWNRSVMELGALVCTGAGPLCSQCPLAGICEFFRLGLPGLGVKPTRKVQKWAGTNRQVRGIILQALRDAGSGDDAAGSVAGDNAGAGAGAASLSAEQVESLYPNSQQLHECLESLESEGLIRISVDGSVSFA
jgi:A/G-specific adenine glycosylase